MSQKMSNQRYKVNDVRNRRGRERERERKEEAEKFIRLKFVYELY